MEDWSLDIINDYCKANFKGEFLCEIAEGKGRIMIAQKAIAQGELLFQELPLHIVMEDEDNEAFNVLKRLCEDNPDSFHYEPLWYWTALCSLTEEQLKAGPNVGSLRPVTLEQQQRLLCLYHEPVTQASHSVKSLVERLALTVEPVLVEELLQAWILNCFEHSEEPHGYSAYFASSFISHSCFANAIWTEGDDAIHVLRAREAISAGDEISISYLEEQELLHAAEARKSTLQDTKRFQCTCPRCAAPSPDSENPVFDVCRGFTCRSCKSGGIFYRLDLCKQRAAKGKKGKKGKGKGKGIPMGLDDAVCVECGARINADESERLLEEESKLEKKLNKVDELLEEKDIQEVLKRDGIGKWLKLASNCGPVGPQHWLCDRVWDLMEKFYASEDSREEQRRMLQLRVDYQRKAYPGLSGTLAWTLEQQGDTILRHLGFGAKVLPSDKQLLDSMAEQVKPIFEESLRILILMFGRDHEYYTTTEKKYNNAKKFLEKRSKVTS